ncbi:40s ribosomal protein s3a [Lynx pardinus]|uniref:40s ribosomal protein s3a n=1 Tax=Lynx pardinus TaxID=191816 RepID=A0A485PEX1_LYNPA|nr:40s ribosomal protein s3a [Lynx pardinus]
MSRVSFHGMDLTHDKMCFMVKKVQNMIEAHADVKTTDGYLFHLFVLVLLKKQQQQQQQQPDLEDLLCSAPTGPPDSEKDDKNMTQKVETNDLKELVNKLILDSIRKDIEKTRHFIYPPHDIFVRKVKMLKTTKSELGKLMELHSEGSSSGNTTGDEDSAHVERADGYEPPVQVSV